MTKLQINDRVQVGTPGTWDHDNGTVIELDDLATVAWDNNTQTRIPAAELLLIPDWSIVSLEARREAMYASDHIATLRDRRHS